MPKKVLSVSIVIPVYNEEQYLAKCLDAIAAQTEMPDEVIVVDNNSTDRSIEIAKAYKFVRVLYEKRQHQTFAQKLGFDNATGDILCRIDADTIIPKNWTSLVKAAFQNSSSVVAISGDGDPYDVPLRAIGTFAFRMYHHNISRLFAGHVMLWGANMAIRSGAWRQVCDRMAYRPDIWEDYELSFWLSKIGRIKFVKSMRVRCSFRAAHRSLPYQFFYQLRAARTFSLHAGKIKTVCFAVVWYTMIWVAPFAIADRYIWKWRSRRAKPYA